MLPDFSIYDAIASPVFVLREDEHGDVVYAFLNAEGCARLGCDLANVVGKTAAELFSGRAAEAVHSQQRRAWQRGEPLTYEIAIPIGDDMFTVLTRLVPQYDDSGALSHMVGLSQDITNEKRLEQAQAMTAAMVDDMEEFVSFAAHDLRSPIANVKALADLVREDFVDMGDGKLEMIQMIEDISEGALILVTDVLQHATAAGSASKPTKFDFGLMCRNILITLDPASQHNVQITESLVEADATAVQIVVRNLIDNAIKHAGLDQIELLVTLDAPDQDVLVISVSDNGVGFQKPPEALGQQDGAQSKSGFGLAALRRLVHARGGTIDVVPGNDGAGAEVRVRLPGRVACGPINHAVA